ncbi:MAG: NHL repeat-containing protein [Bacillota bacterium]|nr:NHL repeat-containing protein [Bacillota bacterium]
MKNKAIFTIPIIIILSLYMGTSSVFAKVPYPSFSFGPEGKPFPIQTPYMPENVIGNTLYQQDQGKLVNTLGLNNPNDIFIDKNDNLFISDSFNNRVVEINGNGILLQEFGMGNNPKSRLNAPDGVYVSQNGDVYVADTGNQRIAVYQSNGQFLKEYKKPDDVSLKNIMFAPIQLSIDERGFLFVVLRGSDEGVAVLSPDGKFQGFFGRNVTQLSLIERIKRNLYTKQQLATNSNQVAASVSDVYIGNDNYVYTCTQNVSTNQIKKLNTKGEDLFDNIDFNVNNDNFSANGDLSFSSITVDKNGFIYAVDKENGLIFIYDNNGHILASFGMKLTGNNFRIGRFGMPVSIAVNSKGEIYVVDQSYNGIQVFKPTNFMKEVFTATNLYNNGEYSKSKPYWEDILKKNVFYYEAHLALGEIYYENQQWSKSLSELKLAKNQKMYSDALWQLRVVWVQKNLNKLVAALVLLFSLFFIAKKFNIKLKIKKLRIKP